MVRLYYNNQNYSLQLRREDYRFGFYDTIRYQQGLILRSSLSPGGRYWMFDLEKAYTTSEPSRYTADLSAAWLPLQENEREGSVFCHQEIFWSRDGLLRAWISEDPVASVWVEDCQTGDEVGRWKEALLPYQENFWSLGMEFISQYYGGEVSEDGRFCHFWTIDQIEDTKLPDNYLLLGTVGDEPYQWAPSLEEPVRSAVFCSYQGSQAVLFTTPGMIGLITGLEEGIRRSSVCRRSRGRGIWR